MKIFYRIIIQTLKTRKEIIVKQTWVLRSLVREKEFRSSAKDRKEIEVKETKMR
jgi:hypothetical protein